MKENIKLFFVYIFFGIAIGCTFFVLMCLSYSLFGEEEHLEPIFKDFTRQSLGAVLVGIACGSTAIVYRFERPSYLAKTVIHFCAGMGVFYPVAIKLGWIPFFPERKIVTFIQFLFSCCIFFVIRFCFYLFSKNEAKKINKKLKELEKSKEKI